MTNTNLPHNFARRLVVVAGLAKWLGAAATGGVVGNFAYDALTKREEKVELLHLFPSFDATQLVPGSHHPEEGFHPDVLAALNGLLPMLNALRRTTPVDFKMLPVPDRSKDLLLLGGPISNELSRELHGHAFTGSKISPLPTRRSGFRWHFFYPDLVAGEPPYSRYVSNTFRSTMRKALVDTKAPSSARLVDSRTGADGFIANDYLLITVQPNSVVEGSGTTIVEVADLQGQGDKAFATVLATEALRRELHSGIKAAKSFQALYEVPVQHNNLKRTTSPGVPKLVGLQLL